MARKKTSATGAKPDRFPETDRAAALVKPAIEKFAAQLVDAGFTESDLLKLLSLTLVRLGSIPPGYHPQLEAALEITLNFATTSAHHTDVGDTTVEVLPATDDAFDELARQLRYNMSRSGETDLTSPLDYLTEAAPKEILVEKREQIPQEVRDEAKRSLSDLPVDRRLGLLDDLIKEQERYRSDENVPTHHEQLLTLIRDNLDEGVSRDTLLPLFASWANPNTGLGKELTLLNRKLSQIGLRLERSSQYFLIFEEPDS